MPAIRLPQLLVYWLQQGHLLLMLVLVVLLLLLLLLLWLLLVPVLHLAMLLVPLHPCMMLLAHLVLMLLHYTTTSTVCAVMLWHSCLQEISSCGHVYVAALSCWSCKCRPAAVCWLVCLSTSPAEGEVVQDWVYQLLGTCWTRLGWPCMQLLLLPVLGCCALHPLPADWPQSHC